MNETSLGKGEDPMRYLLWCCVGFAMGCGAFIWAFSGKMVYYAIALLLVLGFCFLLFRRKKFFRALCCLLLSCSVGLSYCTVYHAVYLSPVQAVSGVEHTYDATVCREPELLSSGWYSIEVRTASAGRLTRAILYSRQPVAYEIGDHLHFTAKLKWAETTKGEDLYYPARGIRLTGSLPENVNHTKVEGISIWDFPMQFSASIRRLIENLLPKDAAGLLIALLTGDRALLPAVLREKLSVTGIYHMVSVSGMHVTILIGVVRALFRRRYLTAAVGLPLLIFFTLMTGASAGTVRASLMLGILLLAPLLKRENDSPTTLGFAGLLILLSNPYELASVSFQLTFCATAGILYLTPRMLKFLAPGKRIGNKLLRWLYRFWRAVASVLSVTLAAQLTTIPLNMVYFGQISVISPLTNLLTSFTVTLTFVIGLFLVLLGLIAVPLAAPFVFVATGLIRYVIAVTEFLFQSPFAAMYTISPYAIIFVLFLYFVTILLLFSKEKIRLVFSLGSVVVVLCVCILMGMLRLRLPEFSFTMLDVGQGQCLLAYSEGMTLMIDCGGDADTIAARAAVAQLSTMGRKRLDVLVLSHYDADHAGGAPLLMELLDVGMILAPDIQDEYGLREEIEAAAVRTGTEFRTVTTEPVVLSLGNSTATVYPPVAYTSDNETSLSVLCSFRRYDILVTGDMGTASEALLLKLYDLPDIEALVAGHHGSKKSTSEELLKTLTPELVLISVGENSFGHPAEETIHRILASGAEIRRTDEEGNITIRR